MQTWSRNVASPSHGNLAISIGGDQSRRTMTKGYPDVVVFDLDGTLADTASDLAAALNHVLATLGRASIETGEVRHLVGHGARALIRLPSSSR